MVPLLHRYVLFSVLLTSLAAVALFTFILLTGNLLRDMVALVAEGRLTPVMFARLVVILLPYVLSYALPLGILTGVLLSLGRLSSQQEITAMRTAGIGLARLSTSILLLGILGTFLSLIINFQYGPKARTQYRLELARAVQANPLGFVLERTFIHDFPGYIFYIGERQGGVMRDFWIWEINEERQVEKLIRAESGFFDLDEETLSLNLILERGQTELRDPQNPEDFSRVPRSLSFQRASLQLPLNRLIGDPTIRRKLAWMTFPELLRERDRIRTEERMHLSEEEWRRLDMQVKMVVHEKFAMSFAVLAFSILAIPLGIKVQRKETTVNLTVALFLSMGYYFLLIVIGWLDQFPVLRPDLLLWLPNLFFQLLGIYLFRRVGRH